MSSHLYVGPLASRYQTPARDLAAARSGVEAWLGEVNTSLAQRLREPLAWSEDGELHKTVLGSTALTGVRLLAVYGERPELDLPDLLPATLDDDPAYAEAAATSFQKSRYGHLLVAELWLPGDFDFTFVVAGADGIEVTVGSLAALRDQVRWLDERTLRAGDKLNPSDAASREFVASARYGISAFRQAVAGAHASHQPLWLGPAEPIQS